MSKGLHWQFPSLLIWPLLFSLRIIYAHNIHYYFLENVKHLCYFIVRYLWVYTVFNKFKPIYFYWSLEYLINYLKHYFVLKEQMTWSVGKTHLHTKQNDIIPWSKGKKYSCQHLPCCIFDTQYPCQDWEKVVRYFINPELDLSP